MFFKQETKEEEPKKIEIDDEGINRIKQFNIEVKEADERMINSLKLTSGSEAEVHQNESFLVLIEGLKLGTIVLNNSTMDDVIREYGNPSDVIIHNHYSVESIYKQLGLSFYFRYDDKTKTIFVITAFSPCNIKTTKGLILGKHTLRDAELIYGKSPFSLSHPQGTNIYSLSLIGEGSGLILEIPKKDINIPKRKLKDYYYDTFITRFEIVDHSRKRT